MFVDEVIVIQVWTLEVERSRKSRCIDVQHSGWWIFLSDMIQEHNFPSHKSSYIVIAFLIGLKAA